MNTARVYNRLAMNRKLHALLNEIPDAPFSREGVKADLCHQVSDGRTIHSSELTDPEHYRLVMRVEDIVTGRQPENRDRSGFSEAEKPTSPYVSGLPHADLDHRPGMATGKQVRKIEAMWRDRSRAEGMEAQDKALRQFLSGRFKVANLRFLTRRRASDVIVALEKMEEN